MVRGLDRRQRPRGTTTGSHATTLGDRVRLKIGWALILLSTFALSCVTSTEASASTALRVIGDAARLPAEARLIGPMSSRASMRVTVALNPTSASELQAYATAVSTPASEDYGRYLTVGEFARRFGASTWGIGAVERELRSAGLRIASVPANHLSVEVTGDVGQVARAFTMCRHPELERCLDDP